MHAPLFSRKQALLVFCSLWLGGLLTFWPASGAHAADDTVSIVVFQVLGIEKTMPKILELIDEAYKKHTGKSALAMNVVEERIGRYGLKKFSACSLMIDCFLKLGKENLKTRYGLLLGLGGFGEKVLVDFLLLDFQSGKQLQRISQTFDGIKNIQDDLPKVMQTLFPRTAVTQLKITGSPVGAQVYLDEQLRGQLPFTLQVEPEKEIKLKITAPEHRTYEQTLTVKTGSTKELTVQLPKAATPPERLVARREPDVRQPDRRVAVVEPRPRIPPKQREPSKGDGKPWYQHWWIWAVAGGVVVVGAVVVGVAAASARYDRLDVYVAP